jgi:hypothetical protein
VDADTEVALTRKDVISFDAKASLGTFVLDMNIDEVPEEAVSKKRKIQEMADDDAVDHDNARAKKTLDDSSETHAAKSIFKKPLLDTKEDDDLEATLMYAIE